MEHQHHAKKPFWKTPLGVGAALAAIAASAYLYVTHRDHVIAALPFLFLAACPLMHVFMHRGHGHGQAQAHEDTRRPADASQAKAGAERT